MKDYQWSDIVLSITNSYHNNNYYYLYTYKRIATALSNLNLQTAVSGIVLAN